MSARERLVGAIKANDVSTVRALLAQEPGLAARSGESPVLTAVYHRAGEILDLLLATNPPLDIFEASAAGKLDRLRQLLVEAPDAVRQYSDDGWTPLHLAGHFGRLDAAALLLARGADVNAISRNDLRNQPLEAAVAGQAPPAVVALLLDAGAEVDARYAAGHTALHVAAANGDFHLVRLLVFRGADPTATNDDGQTPLQLAEAGGHALVVKFLRDR